MTKDTIGKVRILLDLLPRATAFGLKNGYAIQRISDATYVLTAGGQTTGPAYLTLFEAYEEAQKRGLL